MKYFPLKECLICGSEMKYHEVDMFCDGFKCKNNCLSVSEIFEGTEAVGIFNDIKDYWQIDKNLRDENKELIYKQIEERINYWKESDRYLLKILEV